MIFFGTRGITTTPDRGDFHCPSCHTNNNYELKRVRRFFTLYFIPLIPLDKLGEYVECLACKNTYKPQVLEFDPAKNARVVEAEFHVAVKKVMIHMLLSDGQVDDAEVSTAIDIFSRITGDKIDEKLMREEILEVQDGNEDFSSVLDGLQGCLNDEGKEMVLKAAHHVALSDGTVQTEEKAMLDGVGKSLGMTSAHIQGVLSSA